MALALGFQAPPQKRRGGRRSSMDNGLAPAADMLKGCAVRRPECAGARACSRLASARLRPRFFAKETFDVAPLSLADCRVCFKNIVGTGEFGQSLKLGLQTFPRPMGYVKSRIRKMLSRPVAMRSPFRNGVCNHLRGILTEKNLLRPCMCLGADKQIVHIRGCPVPQMAGNSHLLIVKDFKQHKRVSRPTFTQTLVLEPAKAASFLQGLIRGNQSPFVLSSRLFRGAAATLRLLTLFIVVSTCQRFI
jgi:hypothetical protein